MSEVGRHSSISKMNEKRKRGMQEIHAFYSRQHIPLKKDFEEIEDAYTRISLAEWNKFCADFEMSKQYNLSQKEIVEIFKKSSFAHTPLTFENF